MIKAILGRKIGMTRIYTTENEIVPVTVIQAGPCKIVEVRSYNNKHTVQIAFGEKKNRNGNKPLLGHLTKNGINFLPESIREVPIDNPQEYKSGDEINSSIFVENELIDVQGTTKGHGFAGVMKRWNFGGGPRTHGQSDRQRHPGAVGSQRPQRVLKGMKMAGHYGVETVTVKNLKIVKVDTEKNLVLVHGSVPGPKNCILVLKKNWSRSKTKRS